MSRGLSQTQEKVMERIKDRGYLGVKEVAKIYHEIRVPKEDRILPMGAFWNEVQEIDNIKSIYRMMRILEDRGLVGALLHKRPREWYYVEWDNDVITVHSIKKGNFCWLMVRNGVVELRSKGSICTFHKEK